MSGTGFQDPAVDAPADDRFDGVDDPGPGDDFHDDSDGDSADGGRRDGFPVAKPRLPADGIRAVSRRGDIAATWWSRRFLKAIESPETASRLARGKSYARSGQVLSLSVGPGVVAAIVQGSRRQPYAVTIAAPPPKPAQWKRAVTALGRQAAYSAELLAGRMPEDVEQVLAPLGLALFPGAHELDMDCSCPDWSSPCKHVAAVCFLLAEQFDTDPFIILHWRGMPRQQLLNELRAQRSRQAGGDVPDDEPDELGGFWRGGALPPATPADPDAAARLLERLGPVGVAVGGVDLAKALAPAYQAMVRHRWESPLLTGDPAVMFPERSGPLVDVSALPQEGEGQPDAAAVRAWARENGIEVNPRGRPRADVVRAYLDAHRETGTA